MNQQAIFLLWEHWGHSRKSLFNQIWCGKW